MKIIKKSGVQSIGSGVGQHWKHWELWEHCQYIVLRGEQLFASLILITYDTLNNELQLKQWTNWEFLIKSDFSCIKSSKHNSKTIFTDLENKK